MNWIVTHFNHKTLKEPFTASK